jgi:hypothetical protein
MRFSQCAAATEAEAAAVVDSYMLRVSARLRHAELRFAAHAAFFSFAIFLMFTFASFRLFSSIRFFITRLLTINILFSLLSSFRVFSTPFQLFSSLHCSFRQTLAFHCFHFRFIVIFIIELKAFLLISICAIFVFRYFFQDDYAAASFLSVFFEDSAFFDRYISRFLRCFTKLPPDRLSINIGRIEEAAEPLMAFRRHFRFSHLRFHYSFAFSHYFHAFRQRFRYNISLLYTFSSFALMIYAFR